MRLTAEAKRTPPSVVSKGVPVPVPTGGWDAISALANMPADRAVQLDNWVPRPGWIEPRKGYIPHATGLGSQVTTVMAYNSFNTDNDKLFAVAGGTIWDVTTAGAAVPTIVTGLAHDQMQFIQFSNASATQYLIAVDGNGGQKIYDGTAWANLVVTGTGVASGTFVNVNQHQGRLWFVQFNSTDPCYLPVGDITGTAVVFPLGEFMSKGGFVVAIGTWTIDTRQNVDEYIAFITSRGEVIVYAGTDPSTAETWSLVGRYQLGRPLGYRCYSRISGDLLIATIDGVIGMSEMLSTDRAAANRVSLTSVIQNAMAQAAQSSYEYFGWQISEYAKGTLAIVNVPIASGISNLPYVTSTFQFVMNTITGAWCKFTGITSNTWEVDARDNVYFGGNDGTVYRWDSGWSDNGTAYTCICKTAYSSFGNSPQLKRYTAIQPLVISNEVTLSIGINVNFIDDPSLSTDVFEGGEGSVITPGTGPFPVSPTSNNWIGVFGMGHYVSVVTEVTLNTQSTVTLQLNGWNLTAESGAFV
jgi:hypothetical protein